jgi:hypothetical protein
VPARHLVGGGPAYPPQLSSTPTVHTVGNTCPRRVGGWDSDNNPGSACDPARRRAEKRRALRDVAPTSPVNTLFPRPVTVQDGRHRTALTVPPPEITLSRDPVGLFGLSPNRRTPCGRCRVPRQRSYETACILSVCELVNNIAIRMPIAVPSLRLTLQYSIRGIVGPRLSTP